MRQLRFQTVNLQSMLCRRRRCRTVERESRRKNRETRGRDIRRVRRLPWKGLALSASESFGRRESERQRQFKATRASRRTTATGLDGTGWEDSIVNGGSQGRTTRRRYFRMAPSEGTKGAVGGEPPLPPWRRVCLHAARNRLEGKRKENE
ncbi:hypothetical protein ALC56_03312 [Trachymyrmex septentrionalis]|uniref:Uncharacterized protein n=1 Tax=Trachymyrmex septentrionalis TaxID=34720 RepID=A0A195FQH1_9HYME|nr:hypothetical protein ALC56_03312 [Trachymyrmex septentrionalis]